MACLYSQIGCLCLLWIQYLSRILHLFCLKICVFLCSILLLCHTLPTFAFDMPLVASEYGIKLACLGQLGLAIEPTVRANTATLEEKKLSTFICIEPQSLALIGKPTGFLTISKVVAMNWSSFWPCSRDVGQSVRAGLSMMSTVVPSHGPLQSCGKRLSLLFSALNG